MACRCCSGLFLYLTATTTTKMTVHDREKDVVSGWVPKDWDAVELTRCRARGMLDVPLTFSPTWCGVVWCGVIGDVLFSPLHVSRGCLTLTNHQDCIFNSPRLTSPSYTNTNTARNTHQLPFHPPRRNPPPLSRLDLLLLPPIHRLLPRPLPHQSHHPPSPPRLPDPHNPRPPLAFGIPH